MERCGALLWRGQRPCSRCGSSSEPVAGRDERPAGPCDDCGTSGGPGRARRFWRLPRSRPCSRRIQSCSLAAAWYPPTTAVLRMLYDWLPGVPGSNDVGGGRHPLSDVGAALWAFVPYTNVQREALRRRRMAALESLQRGRPAALGAGTDVSARSAALADHRHAGSGAGVGLEVRRPPVRVRQRRGRRRADRDGRLVSGGAGRVRRAIRGRLRLPPEPSRSVRDDLRTVGARCVVPAGAGRQRRRARAGGTPDGVRRCTAPVRVAAEGGRLPRCWRCARRVRSPCSRRPSGGARDCRD